MSSKEVQRLQESGRPGESGGIGVFARVTGKRQPIARDDYRDPVPIGKKHQADVPAHPTYDSVERGDQLVMIERVLVPFVMAVEYRNVAVPPKPPVVDLTGDDAASSHTDLVSDDSD